MKLGATQEKRIKMDFLIALGAYLFAVAGASLMYLLVTHDILLFVLGLGVMCLGGLLNLTVVSRNNWTTPYRLRWEELEEARRLTNNFQYRDYRWGQDHPVHEDRVLFLSSKSIRFPLLADIIPLSASTASIGDMFLYLGSGINLVGGADIFLYATLI